MEETMLILNCKVAKVDGKRFDSQDFFNILLDNGFTIEGGVDEISMKDLRKELEEIKSSMNNEIIENMINKVMNYYEEESPICTYDFFAINSSTSIFTSVFKDNLRSDMSVKFEKLNDKWWEISDYIQSELGGIVCDYIDNNYRNR